MRVLVQDASESAVTGVKVQILNTGTGVRAEVATSGDGYAVFSPIMRGVYEVSVTQPGFKSVKLSDVRINIDERRLVRIRLDVATVSETVEVTNTIAVTQTEQGSIGQVTTGRTAVELPLAGRRYTELALLAPGVAPSTLTP